MNKRLLIPLLLLLPFTLGFTQVSPQSNELIEVFALDETPDPFVLPGIEATDEPCNPDAAHGLFFYRTDCPHCADSMQEVLYPLEEELGPDLHILLVNIDYANNYEVFIKALEHFDVSAEDRAIPTIVLGEEILIGETTIKRQLRKKTLAGLEDGGIEWPSIDGFDPDAIIDESSANAAGQACSIDGDSCEVGSPIYAAYFYQTGCQECDLVEADLAYLRSEYPQLLIEDFNIYDNAGLADWMAARVGRNDLDTPAIFIGDQAWIGDKEIEPGAIASSIECLQAEGSPRFWDSYSEEQGNQSIIDRFRSMSWLTVVLAGLVDGLNPCAFATLIFFVSYLSISGRKGKEVLLVGGTFTLGVFLAYLLIGFGFYRVLDLLGEWLNILGDIAFGITAVLCLVLAFFSFSDFLKTRKGDLSDMSLKLPDNLRKMINKTIRGGRNIQAYAFGSFVTGLIVSLLELACTGQVYLPTIIFVSSVPELRLQSTLYLLLYNLMFIIPLVVVFVLVYFGTTSKQLTDFMQKHGSAIKLAMSILFLSLAVWLATLIF